jgi:hypothetical protein
MPIARDYGGAGAALLDRGVLGRGIGQTRSTVLEVQLWAQGAEWGCA